MRELVFATNNKNKLFEIREILKEHPFQILSLEDIGCNEDIPEPFETLQENAMAKAQYVKEKFGLDCFADDTGLEIEALNGRPGVFSARYAGEPSDSQKNMAKVLNEMMEIKNRKARFRTVIALILNDNQYYFEGNVNGRISERIEGEKGFGYDPIFYPENNSITFAQMSVEEKNEISHRARAVNKLIDFLKTI